MNYLLELSMYDTDMVFAFIQLYLQLDEKGECEKSLFLEENNSLEKNFSGFKKMFSVMERGEDKLILDRKVFHMFMYEKDDKRSYIEKCASCVRSFDAFKKDNNLMKNADMIIENWIDTFPKQDIYSIIQEVINHALTNPQWANPIKNWGKTILNWLKRASDPYYWDKFKKYQKHYGTREVYNQSEAIRKAELWKKQSQNQE